MAGRSLQVSHPGYSIVRKLYSLIARGHASLAQWDEERRRRAVVDRPAIRKMTSFYFWKPACLARPGRSGGAEARFKQLFEERPKPPIGGMENGLRGYRTRAAGDDLPSAETVR